MDIFQEISHQIAVGRPLTLDAEPSDTGKWNVESGARDEKFLE